MDKIENKADLYNMDLPKDLKDLNIDECRKLGNVVAVNGADKFKAEILEHRAVENNIF